MQIDAIKQKLLLNIEDFLQIYGISRGKFYSEVKKKKIRIKKFGSRTYILPKDAEEWAQNLPNGE